MKRAFIPAHGGFERLASYQKTQIIFRATYFIAGKWVRAGSRTRDQMEQSARSGKQNIVEGSLASATSKQMELTLTNVARASIGELLEDFKDFLMVRNLPLWPKDSEKAMAIRDLSKGQNVTYETYRTYVESDDPEVVGNVMICLCNQACYLLDQQIRELELSFVEEGGIRERMTKARIEARNQADQAPVCPLCNKPMRRRTARKGTKAGTVFWGCPDFPECKGTRALKVPSVP